MVGAVHLKPNSFIIVKRGRDSTRYIQNLARDGRIKNSESQPNEQRPSFIKEYSKEAAAAADLSKMREQGIDDYSIVQVKDFTWTYNSDGRALSRTFINF